MEGNVLYDHADFVSVVKFTEECFGPEPPTNRDATASDLSNAFNFGN
jgi:hypothetical protein